MLITFEGIDGSGKTTQASKLCEYLIVKKYNVSFYREPGSTVISEAIRNLILNNDLDPITETLLFEASRSYLVFKKIKEDINQGKIVILDRFIDSTVAYQGYGKNVPLDIIHTLNNIATYGVYPSITFLLDIPIDVVAKRLNREKTRFEELDFLNRVRNAYLEIAKMHSDRFVVINADRHEEEVFADILNCLQEKRAILL